MNTRPEYVEPTINKIDFSKEARYSLANDASNECNTFCGSGNQTCFKNCLIKSKQLNDVLRDYLVYSGVQYI